MMRSMGTAVWLCVGAACAPNLDADYGGSEEAGRTACGTGLAPHDVRVAAALSSPPINPPWGKTLDVVGVATLALSREPERAGFFLQSIEDDADPLSPEALFVAWPGAAPATGTRVHARGTLGETAGSAELQAIEQLDECGSVEVSPRQLDARELAPPEAWDGLWVRASGDWRVVDVPASPAGGRLTASAQGRIFASGHALASTETAELWTLQAAAPAADALPVPRLGAALGELEGVLSVRGPARQLFTAVAPAWPSQAPPPPARPAGSGLRIVGLNLDNYFVSLSARGARSGADLARQRDALVALLVALDADILALTELENRGADSLIHLLEGLDRALAADQRYAFEEAPAPAGSVLRAGIAFRQRRVRTRGAAWFSDVRGFRRAPLFQAFASEGLSFTLGVVHLASKRCDDEPVVVPPEGCGDQTRVREAELLLDAASSLAASAPLEPLLLMGDFNADEREAPLELLAEGGYRDLLSALPAADRYSYVFDGRASLLDHALARDEFHAHVRSAAIWHINADEPRASALADAPTASPRRSSDHDPIVIDLHLGAIRPTGL
jgi:predicted extracellular nuclease